MNREAYWIWLSQGLGYGSRSVKRILEQFSGPEDFLKASEEQWRACRLTAREFSALRQHNLESAEKIWALCREKGILVITPEDNFYPRCLYEIANPPVLLYLQGKLPRPEESLCLAVVGSRKATADGIKSAFEFSYQLAKAGVTIVSGGALGVDQAALEGALQAGGSPVAVLGSGVDVDYPPNFTRLRTRILEAGGGILSEYPPTTAPYRGNFPVRNRILSGLSKGVFVIEAAQRSGALITARLAVEQNRDVFALPGSVRSELSYGPNQLIKDGAKLVTCLQDILEEYAYAYVGTVQIPEPEFLSPGKDFQGIPSQRKKASAPELLFRPEEFSEDAVRLYRQMAAEPQHLDMLSQKAGLPAAKALQAVTELELNEVIEVYAGQRYGWKRQI